MLLKETLQTAVGKWLKIDRKNSKMWKFLSTSDIFSEFLFEIGKKIRYNKSFEKLQMIKLGPKHVFQKST